MKRAKTKVTKRPRGRPTKYRAKRITITVRLQEPVYRRVAVAANANGRSISEEFEHRIGRSFEDETAFPDPELRQLAIRLITRFSDAGRFTDMNRTGAVRPVNEWINDPDSYESAMLAVMENLIVANPAMSNVAAWDYVNWLRCLGARYTPQQLREAFLDRGDYASTDTSAKDKKRK